MKIGILADTLTDTAMGKAYFERFGFETVCRAVKEDSRACFEFFREPKHLRDEYISIILGCTHFPYLLNRLREYTSLEIIDPCDIMRKAVYQIEENQVE